MVESMDAELGRLLAGLGNDVRSNTNVVVIGDNGTQNDATEAPFVPGHGKGTLFEGGLRVPLVIAGPMVTATGTECRALVNSTDIFDTCLHLAGATGDLPTQTAYPRDSTSLLPYLADPNQPSLRQFIFAERFFPNNDNNPSLVRHAIRGLRYKLNRNVIDGIERFYDLQADPFEATNLLLGPLEPEARQAYFRLQTQLKDLLES